MISHRAYHQTLQDRPLFGGFPAQTAQTYIHKDDSPSSLISPVAATLSHRVSEAVPRATTVHHSGICSLMSGTSCRNSADQPLKLEMAVPPIVAGSKLKPQQNEPRMISDPGLPVSTYCMYLCNSMCVYTHALAKKNNKIYCYTCFFTCMIRSHMLSSV